MSSILDALERASKERENKQAEKISSDALGRHSAADRQSALEKQLRTENEKQRRLVFILSIVFGAVVFLAVSAMGIMMMVKAGRDAEEREAERIAAEIATRQKSPLEQIIPALASSPKPDAPQQPAVAQPTPAPTEAPTPAPSPSPSPAPSATAAAYIQNSTEADVKNYKGVFTDGQIIRPTEVGWEVEGVMELKGGNIAIINGKQIKAGQKAGQLQVIEVRSGLITADVGDGTIVKVRF